MKKSLNITVFCVVFYWIGTIQFAQAQKNVALNPSDQTSNLVCGGGTEASYATLLVNQTSTKLAALGYTVKIFYGITGTPDAVNTWNTQNGGANAFVSMHTNGGKYSGDLCLNTSSYSTAVYNKDHKATDITLANKVVDGLVSYLGLGRLTPDMWWNSSTQAYGNLGVLNGISSTIPCCVEEALFHDTPSNATILRSSSGQDKIANGVATGIDNYLKNNTSTTPPNDNPCDAGTPTLTVSTNCSFTEGTNVGATNSSVPNVTCDGTSNGDVWYKFKVPSSGSVTIETDAINLTNEDMGMVLYTGSSCSSLSYYGCYANGSTYSQYMPRAELTGLTPNATMWIRLYEYNNNNFGTFKICVTGASSSNCSITSFDPNSITLNPESVSSSSGDDIIVNGQANCTFSVSESCSWLTVTPSSGTMNSVGQVLLNYTVQENSSTSSRSCTVSVNGSTFTIKQNGCSADFSRGTKSVDASGTTYSLDIDSYSPCSWNIQNSDSWVHLSETSGTGSPTISVTVDSYTSTETRTATLTIEPGNETHVITQQGIVPSLSVTPTSLTLESASSSSDQIDVSSNVSWTASDDVSWLIVTPTSGSNNGSITVTATSANPSTINTRSGIVTISGGGITRTLTVTQSKTTETLNLTVTPASLTLGSASNSSDEIAVNSNVSWTASDDASWLSVTPASGSNNGSITVTATSANPSTINTRSGIVTISGGGITRTLTVTQSKTTETLNLTVTPASLTLGSASNSSDEIAVNSNVSWTASDDASWLSVTPTSGSNDGTITVTATSANTTTSSRSGTVTITGSGITRTVSVTQSEPPLSSYCAAGSNLQDEYIGGVSIGTINSGSGAGLGGYQDITTLSTTMQIGIKSLMEISLGNDKATDQILVWVDWNNDRDFTDAGEKVYSTIGNLPNQYITANFAPPADATIGITRMRIRLHNTADGPNTTPCGNSTWGEVEDYSINVTNPSVPFATLTIGNTSGSVGNTISIPVSAIKFSDVVSFQFTIIYDKTKLDYVNCSNWSGGTDVSAILITPFINDGKITFVYNDAAINIVDGKFFELNFTIKSNATGSAALSWSDIPTIREISNSQSQEIPCTYNNGTLSIVTGFNLSGKLSYENTAQTTLSNISISLLNSNGQSVGSAITDATGSFSFPGLSNGTYSLKPDVKIPWGGASAMDITSYKKHIGNLSQLTQVQVKSGDVNGSNSLSSMDLTVIKQRIGAQISSFTTGDWVYDPVTAIINGTNLVQNIKSLCYGDANGSYTSSGLKSVSNMFLAGNEKISLLRNGEFEIPFILNKDVNKLSSVTLSINYPAELFEVNDIKMIANNEDLYYSVMDGKINVIYSTLNSISLKEGDLLMTIRFSLKKNASQGITNDNHLVFSGPGEFGDYDDNVLDDVKLIYSTFDVNTLINEFRKDEIKVYPNPASNLLTVTNVNDTRINILDMLGRSVLSVNCQSNSIDLNIRSLIPGTYTLKVNKNNEIVYRKFTVVR